MKCLAGGSLRSCLRRRLSLEETWVARRGTLQFHIGSGSRAQLRRSSSKQRRPRTAIFFPGQGVQKVGMLTPWLEAFPATARPLVEEIDHVLDYRLSKIIEEGPNSILTATVNAQPAIMACSILILRILERDFGFKPAERVDVALGHSLGEFAALVAAGNFLFEDSLFLVRKRAEVMAECTQRASSEYGGDYGMVALVTEPGHLSTLIDVVHEFLGHDSAGSKSESAEDIPPIQQVSIANVNSKNQIVLSGSIERIATLLTHMKQFGGHDPRAVRLKSDSPFHSPLMIPAKKAMQKMLEGKSQVKGKEDQDLVQFPGVMDCVSNVSARPIKSKAELKDLCARSCVETVSWWESIRYLDQEQNVRRWIGIGPGKVGRNLVGKEVGMRGSDVIKGGGVWAITHPRECEEIMKALDMTESSQDDA